MPASARSSHFVWLHCQDERVGTKRIEIQILGGMICDSLRSQGGRLGQLIRGVVQAPKLHTYHRRRSSQTLMCLAHFSLQIPQLAALQPAVGPPESPFQTTFFLCCTCFFRPLDEATMAP